MDKEEFERHIFSLIKKNIIIDASGSQKKKKKKKNFLYEHTFNSKPICRQSFCALHNFSKHKFEKAVEHIKAYPDAIQFPLESYRDECTHSYTYSETHSIYSANVPDFGEFNNFYYSNVYFCLTNLYFTDLDMLTASMIPNRDKDIMAAQWLEDRFLKYGDHSPNSSNHFLSETFKVDVFRMYEVEQLHYGLPVMDSSNFNSLWNALYPKYLVRPWLNVPGKFFFNYNLFNFFKNNVPGKCNICYQIDQRRKKGGSKVVMEALKQCHHMHRGGMFMLERKAYKERVTKALKNPTKIFSCIMDGMDQSHSQCPYLGSQASFNNPLKQHIQGVLVHGQGSFCSELIFNLLSF